jgi:hypothetical protein
VRWWTRGLLALVALLLVAVGALWLYLDEATQTVLERGGEAALGVATSVGHVSVRPLSGRIEIERVRIANPPGFSDEPFLALETGRVEIALGSLSSDIVVLPSIELRGVALRLEKQGRRANYDGLLARDADDASDGTRDGGGRGVVVRRLSIDGVTAHLDAEIVPGTFRAMQVRIPRIVLDDVGGETAGGVLASELSRLVIDAVLVALVREGVALPRQLVARVGRLPLDVVGEAGALSKGLGALLGGDDESTSRSASPRCVRIAARSPATSPRAAVAGRFARRRWPSQAASSARPITFSSRIGFTPSKIGSTVASTT